MIPANTNALLLGEEAGGAAAYAISRSLRFNSSDSAYLSRTPASAGNRKTWTWAGWVKRSALGSDQSIFCSVDGGTNNTFLNISFNSSDQIFAGAYNYAPIVTSAVFRDASAWYHLVIALDTTQATASQRLKLYINGSEVTGFSTDNRASITQNSDLGINQNTEHYHGRVTRFGSSTYSNFYLADIHFIDGQALTPSSFTEVSATTGQLIPKAYSGSYGTNGFHLPFSDNSTAAALGTDTSGNGNTWTVNNLSASNTTVNATAQLSNLIGTPTAPTTNATFDIGDIQVAGVPNPGNAAYLKLNFSALGLIAPATITFKSYQQGGGGWSVVPSTIYTDAGNVTSAFTFSGNVRSNTVNIPAGATYFALPPSWISVSGGIVANAIGSLVWDGVPVVNYSSSFNDSLVDTPTSYGTDLGTGGEVRGNYATWNPLDNGGLTLANGNLDTSRATASWANVRTTLGISSGKWYWEITPSSTVNGSNIILVGIQKQSGALSTDYLGKDSFGWSYSADSGNKNNNNVTTAYGSSFTNGDVIGVALDADTGALTFYKNNTSQGQAFSGLTSGPYFPAIGLYGTSSASANFGQRAFAYTAPSGFKALVDTNLPSPQVAKPSTAFDVKLYTGNGSTQTISGLGFSPDLVWVKIRSNLGRLTVEDTVRGATKNLFTSETYAEETDTNSITAFTSDGFSLGNNTTGSSNVNVNSATYAAWCWDAGSTTVTNTQGSITSSVRANPSAGFSIVGYTGTGSNATVGHGLGVPPEMLIIKERNNSSNWIVWRAGFSSTQFLYLNATNGITTPGSPMITSAGSTTFGLGTDGDVNQSGINYITYAFAPVAGYSSAFTYTGNGSNSGPFVYLGFRPRFTIIKRTDATASWMMYDSARDVDNPNNTALFAQLSDAETASDDVDYLSNGLKLRTTGASFNASGGTYIGFAWAESPFAYARAR